jgi:hypothetical protein
VKRAPGHWPTLNPVPPGNGGGNDAFFTRLSPTGTALSYSSYFGGSSDDAAQAVALDLASNACLAGWTYSTNFPTGPSPYQGSLPGLAPRGRSGAGRGRSVSKTASFAHDRPPPGKRATSAAFRLSAYGGLCRVL